VRGTSTKPALLVTNHRAGRGFDDESPLSHDEADMVQLAHRYQRLARQRTRGSLKHMHGLALHSSDVRHLDRSRRASSRDRGASLLNMYRKQGSRRRSLSRRRDPLMRSKIDASMSILGLSRDGYDSFEGDKSQTQSEIVTSTSVHRVEHPIHYAASQTVSEFHGSTVRVKGHDVSASQRMTVSDLGPFPSTATDSVSLRKFLTAREPAIAAQALAATIRGHPTTVSPIPILSDSTVVDTILDELMLSARQRGDVSVTTATSKTRDVAAEAGFADFTLSDSQVGALRAHTRPVSQPIPLSMNVEYTDFDTRTGTVQSVVSCFSLLNSVVNRVVITPTNRRSRGQGTCLL
jgi:hypothetical protein